MSSIPNQVTAPTWLSERQQQAWHGFMLMTMQLNAALGKDLLVNTGLSGADYGVLVTLSERDSHSMRIFELGCDLGWEKSRLSHHLTRMAQRGLVAKSHCAQDARGAIVSLTKAGLAALEGAAPQHVAMVRELFIDCIDDEQLATLGEIAERVLARLSAVANEHDDT